MIHLDINYLRETKRIENIVPTIFPDGTSQVWKLDFPKINRNQILSYRIIWQYEKEQELIHVAQLKDIMEGYTENKAVSILYMPYLPYARQDKPVGNTSTFAQFSFSNMINAMNFNKVYALDVHGATNIKNIVSLYPYFLDDLANKYKKVCFPDGGAALRYDGYAQGFYCVKKRNELTGAVEKYSIPSVDKLNLAGQSVLIIDDICDGGATFINCANLLKSHGVTNIDLYVTHGIFSKDKQVLLDAGINKIYTTNSLLKNKADNELVFDVI